MIHLWSILLTQFESELSQLRELLSADELNRLNRSTSEDVKRSFLFSRGCLRKILGQHLRLNPKELRFKYGPHEKPELEPLHDKVIPHFNLSHSRDLLVIALSATQAVGIDVEWVRPNQELDAIARRYFSNDEIKTLSRLNENEKNAQFFRYWTEKEAIVKAMGAGVSGLRKIHQGDWNVLSLKLPEGYVGSIATLMRNDETMTLVYKERFLLTSVPVCDGL